MHVGRTSTPGFAVTSRTTATDAVASLGASVNGVVAASGACVLFGASAIGYAVLGLFRRRIYRRSELIIQMDRTGARSLPIIMLVAALVGMTLVAQTVPTLANFNQQSMVAGIVGVSICRTLGPVLAAIVFTGRVGAAYTAEIGTMKVSEELLALETMGIPPVGFLIAPRVAAATVMLMVLTVVFDVVALACAYAIATTQYGIPADEYRETMLLFLSNDDFMFGIGKALIFSVMVAVVSCFMGFNVRGGGVDVGRATMRSVVICILSIIFADFMLSLLYNILKSHGIVA
jgi:phospholipid/cholesterol/gamma-HCH transport system permease protein